MINTAAVINAGSRQSNRSLTVAALMVTLTLRDVASEPRPSGSGRRVNSLRTSGHTANIAATQRNMSISRWYRSGCGSSDSLNHIAPNALAASTSEASTAKRVWRGSSQCAMAHAASRNATATAAAKMRCVWLDWKLSATRGALARMTAIVAGDSHGTAMAYA